MNLDYFKLMKKHEAVERKSNVLKGVLITVGVIAAVAAAAAVVYTILKKYFTITIECDDCDCDLEECGDDELCCCDADDECDAPEIAEA